MSELLIKCIGVLVAAMIAQKFIKAVQKEISAHDDSSIKGGDDNR